LSFPEQESAGDSSIHCCPAVDLALPFAAPKMGSKKAELSKLFPGLAAGPPQFGSGGGDGGAAQPEGSLPQLLRGGGGVFERSAAWTPLGDGHANKLPFTTVAIVKTPRSPGGKGTKVGGSSVFFTYVNKAGMVRVIHVDTVETGLLRNHTSPVTDVKFCPSHDAMVATTSSDGFAIVWELRHLPEKEPKEQVEYREMLRLRCASAGEVFQATEWHPTEPGILALVHGNTVSVVKLGADPRAVETGVTVDTTRCAVAFLETDVNSIDMCTEEPRMIVGLADGTIAVLNTASMGIGELNKSLRGVTRFGIGDGRAINFCKFVEGRESLVLTAVGSCTILRLWKLNASTGSYKPAYELNLDKAGNDMCCTMHGPYVFVADCASNLLLCTKVNTDVAELEGPVEFQVDCPVYSMFAQSVPAKEQIQLLCQQAKGIQFFTFDPKEDYGAKKSKAQDQKETAKQKPTGLMAPISAAPNVPSAATKPSKPVAAMSSAPPTTTNGGVSLPLQGNLKELFAGLASKLDEDSAKRTKAETERQKALLEVLSKSVHEIPETVDEALRDVLADEGAIGELAAKLSQAIGSSGKGAGSIDPQAMAKILEASLDQVLDKFINKVSESVKSAFVDVFRDSLAPAFEAGVNNMLEQLSSQQDTVMENDELQALRKENEEIKAGLCRIEDLLRQAAGPQAKTQHHVVSSPAPPTTVESSKFREEVMPLVSLGSYNDAFLLVLQELDLELVVATCQALDPAVVLDQAAVALSQPVLLSLIQQLSADLSTEAPLKLKWMCKAGMCLNSEDPFIKDHVQRVLENTVQNMESQRSYFTVADDSSSSNSGMFETVLTVVKSKM